MSIITTATSRVHRPISASLTVAVLLLLGVSAVGGGMAMVTGYQPPRIWLDAIPLVDSWIIPHFGDLAAREPLGEHAVARRILPSFRLDRVSAQDAAG